MRVTFRAQDAARYTGMSYWKILEMAKRGEIPHVRIGKRLILFRRDTLDKWLAEQEAASVQ